MPTKSLEFQAGKVYCVGLTINNQDGRALKRIVRYQGPEAPWQDICSGESAAIERSAILEAIEVPPSVVDAIKLAQDKRPIPESLPLNEYEGDYDEEWDSDVYCDEHDD